MEPNKWGLIRQRDLDLFALPLLYLIDNLSEYSIEEIPASYLDGKKISDSSGNTYSISDGSCVHNLDVSDYEFVLAPVITTPNAITSTGLNNGSGGFSTYCITAKKPTSFNSPYPVPAYVLLSIREQYTNLNVNSVINVHLPILGLRRHRSDNVNPKGLTNADSKSLQSAKADKLNQEADRIRDGVSGDVKEPVLDSVTGDRAADSGDAEADS